MMFIEKFVILLIIKFSQKLLILNHKTDDVKTQKYILYWDENWNIDLTQQVTAWLSSF